MSPLLLTSRNLYKGCLEVSCSLSTRASSNGPRHHVYQDLHPYCCTFEDCPIADRLYDSRSAWFAHELEAHRTSFQCIEGCGQIFVSEANFYTHVQNRHPELAVTAVFSTLKRTSARSANLSEQTLCKVCNEEMTLRKLRKHLGQHLEQLALFALPPNVNDVEDDLNEEHEILIDGAEDELSDTSEILRLEELGGAGLICQPATELSIVEQIDRKAVSPMLGSNEAAEHPFASLADLHLL